MDADTKKVMVAALDLFSSMSDKSIKALTKGTHVTPTVHVMARDVTALIAVLEQVQPNIIDSLLKVRNKEPNADDN